MSKSLSAFALLGLLTIGLAGCGDSPASVEGVVTYKGQPVEGATITFMCDDGVPYAVNSEAGGAFKIGAIKLHGSKYKITVTKTAADAGGGDPESIKKMAATRTAASRKPVKNELPAAYGDFLTTPLKDVPLKGGINKYDVTVN